MPWFVLVRESTRVIVEHGSELSRHNADHEKCWLWSKISWDHKLEWFRAWV